MINEFVMLTADTNYVPVKYMVMNSTVGSTTGATYLWLKQVSYGMDTQTHYETYISAIRDGSLTGGVLGLVGTLTTYSVVALSSVEAYKSKYSNHDGPYDIG